MKQRKNGEEQPYWRIGVFKIRLPFIHYRIEMVELIQGLVLFAIGLGVIPIMESHLGFTYEAALAAVIVFQFLMLIPTAMGVPFVPGMLTPMLPIIIIFLGDFEPGPEAVQALIAVQIIIAMIFLILGLTGLGEKSVKILPVSLKGGILMGAGFAAIIKEIQQGGRLAETPYSLVIGGIVCLFIMYSEIFKRLSQHNKLVQKITDLGIMIPIVIAVLIGLSFKEYPFPTIEWGITAPAFGELWLNTPFVIGFPSVEVFLLAVPIAIIGYIIGYGDIIVGNELIERAKQSRDDEKINYSINTLHYITALRGFLLGILSPHPGMAGPIFTAGTATVTERYTFGRKAMDSIFSGSNSLVWGVFLPLFILPLVTLFRPFMPIALSITLLLTGFLCIIVGSRQLKTDSDRGIAGIMAVVLTVYGATHALVVGIVFYFLIQFQRKKYVAQKLTKEEESNIAN